jgi:hypothetical protein
MKGPLMNDAPLGIRLELNVRATSDYAEWLGRSLLKVAEDNRREPNGGFPTGPVVGLPPSADWASAGMLVSDAARQLDEALPNGQRQRAEAALGALVIGTVMLREALNARGVLPLMLLLGGESAEPSQS